MKEFIKIESMGVYCALKCGNCECGKFVKEYKNFTIAEEKDISIIKESLRYNKESRHWVSNYPWNKDQHHLPNNFNYALGKMKATERRLKSSNQLRAFNLEIDDMIARQVARKLTPD